MDVILPKARVNNNNALYTFAMAMNSAFETHACLLFPDILK
jgi:hypothetical protein